MVYCSDPTSRIKYITIVLLLLVALRDFCRSLTKTSRPIGKLSAFYSFGQGRSKFNVTAEDLDRILPVGWSERAFRTSTKCVVSREQPITIRFANQRKVTERQAMEILKKT